MSLRELLKISIIENKNIASRFFFAVNGNDISENSADEMELDKFNILADEELIVMVYKGKVLCLALK